MTVGLCLKGLSIGALVAVCVGVASVLVLFLLPIIMAVGIGVTGGGTVGGGGGIAGASVTWPEFVSFGIPEWLILAPGAIAFVGGFFWTVFRSSQPRDPQDADSHS
jgi:hypothetical protein